MMYLYFYKKQIDLDWLWYTKVIKWKFTKNHIDIIWLSDENTRQYPSKIYYKKALVCASALHIVLIFYYISGLDIVFTYSFFSYALYREDEPFSLYPYGTLIYCCLLLFTIISLLAVLFCR